MSRTVTVTAADVSLFHVAARELGDPLQAIRIAQASKVGDSWLDGIQTLTIPGQGPDTGGLPAPGTVIP